MGVPDKSAVFKQTAELVPENRPTEMSQHNTTNKNQKLAVVPLAPADVG